MTSLSVFTPSHNSTYLPQLYESLQAQTDQDWRWELVHNNGGSPLGIQDHRVTQHVLHNVPDWVGPLKAYACEQASGEILLEVDHDDLLTPTAVAEVKAAFTDPNIGFAYSNTLHADAELNKVERFSEAFGWRYRDAEFQGHALDEHIAFAPTPDALSRIWYAPNHLRAFRKSVYDKIGGYNKDMRVLDDGDLMCRMYQETEFKHIDKALYLYRIHGANSWLKHNKEIQDNVFRLHDQYAAKLVKIWAERKGLRKLDLGGRIAGAAGYETVDRQDADVVCDLNGAWPVADSSVGVIRAFDVFEHLKDPVHTMKECYRVLAPGGWIFAQVPSTDGRGAFQDPSHCSFWNQNSWAYYSHRNWARYINTPVRFQAPRVYTTPKDARQVCWTIAHLISLKGGYRPPGAIDI